MNRELFKIREWTGNKRWLIGDLAILEYIKQKVYILKNELWWDYNYGLDYQNLNETTISFWIRDILEEFEFITIKHIETKVTDNKIQVSLQLLFDNRELTNNLLFII